MTILKTAARETIKGGDYSREAINRGTAIIRGNLLSASQGKRELRRDTLYNINLLSHLCTPRHIYCFTTIKVIYTFPTWDITHPGFHLQNLKYP